jgi:hypothetical protein
MTNPVETTLFLRFKQGDRQALGQLFEHLRPYVCAIVQNIRRERPAIRADESDLIQDVLMNATSAAAPITRTNQRTSASPAHDCPRTTNRSRKAAGEDSPVSRSYQPCGLTPALGLRAGNAGVFCYSGTWLASTYAGQSSEAPSRRQPGRARGTVNGILETIQMICHSALPAILLGHLRSIDVHYWPGSDGMTLDVAVSCYAQAAADGKVPGKEALLRLYPELAADLQAFFAAQTSSRILPSAPSPPELNGGFCAD